jgi:glycosyltransferase involved in cell wall biosynthesis
VSFGGAEQNLANLVAHLDPSIEIVVMAVDAGIGRSLTAGRPDAKLVVVRPVRDKYDLGPIWEHVRAVRSLRPDVFHASLATTFACQYGILAALLAGARTVVVEQSPIPTASGLQRRLKRLTSRFAAAHVAVGERSARMVEEAVGLPHGRVDVIYNGVDDDAAEPLPRLAGRPVIGSLGRLSNEKGFDIAIRALGELPEATLVLVGDGPERPSLESLATSEGVAERVRFVGWSDEARRYLPGFDVFILPSRFEAFPLAVVEAMLAARPVVAADVGSVDEAVEEGQTGYLFQAEDAGGLAAATGRLLADETLAKRLGDAGRARALTHFTASAMARAYEAVYREVLS